MLPIFQMQQGPQLIIALQDYMSTLAAISSVGATFPGKFIPMKMSRSAASFT